MGKYILHNGIENDAAPTVLRGLVDKMGLASVLSDIERQLTDNAAWH